MVGGWVGLGVVCVCVFVRACVWACVCVCVCVVCVGGQSSAGTLEREVFGDLRGFGGRP